MLAISIINKSVRTENNTIGINCVYGASYRAKLVSQVDVGHRVSPLHKTGS